MYFTLWGGKAVIANLAVLDTYFNKVNTNKNHITDQGKEYILLRRYHIKVIDFFFLVEIWK